MAAVSLIRGKDPITTSFVMRVRRRFGNYVKVRIDPGEGLHGHHHQERMQCERHLTELSGGQIPREETKLSPCVSTQ